MKKSIAVVFALIFVVGVFFVGFYVGTLEPGYNLEESTVYSDEDIQKCAKLAEKNLHTGLPIRKPVRVYYSDRWLDYAKSFLDQIDGVDDVKNILVIKADYLTGKKVQGLPPYSYHSDWSFIFYRKDANSQWKLYTQGCA